MRTQRQTFGAILAIALGLGASSVLAKSDGDIVGSMDFTDAPVASAPVTLPGHDDIQVVFERGKAMRGFTVGKYCNGVLKYIGLNYHPDFSRDKCIALVMEQEGWKDISQADDIDIGQRIWVLSHRYNDPQAFIKLAAEGHLYKVFGSDVEPELLKEALGVNDVVGSIATLRDQVGFNLQALAERTGKLETEVAGNRDTILSVAATVGGIRRDTNERFGDIEATQAQQGTALEELRDAYETIKDAQAKQAGTLSDQDARLSNVEVTQTAQGNTLRQQQGAMNGVLAREILNGVVADRELTMRWYDESWVMYVALALVAALSLFGFGLLQWSKASKKDLRVVNDTANSAATQARQAKEKADSAAKEAGKATSQIGSVKDRLDQVETDLGLLMELDAQGRFNNPALTADLIENLQYLEKPLVLRVKCHDGKYRHVHIRADVDADGKAGLRFDGLKKGHDFVHTLDLASLQRHLAKAVRHEWVIGIQAARKVSEPA